MMVFPGMPTNPFRRLTGKNAFTLFEIRLDDDFIILTGNDQEAAGKLLKGTVVLCLPTSLRVEDVHLTLAGSLRLPWADGLQNPPGKVMSKADRADLVYSHKWDPFIASSPSPGSSAKHVLLPAGNYEWPFELLIPGSMPETIEGLPDASLTYRLKATIARGKLAHDIHAYKRLRILRTLQPSALEFLHGMSIENIWVDKAQYSITVPQKAVAIGGNVPVEMRFTPLLKGLDMTDVTITLVEFQQFSIPRPFKLASRIHRCERVVDTWVIAVTRDEHWQDMLTENGDQEGWVVNATLPLPKSLTACMQDVDEHGIKMKHKLRINVGLKNPDGHYSELRATLPVTIFISPNMLLDDEGNLVAQQGLGSSSAAASAAPPGYGDHVLDRLYGDNSTSGFQPTPSGSGFTSPHYSRSRAASEENLSSIDDSAAAAGVAPAALSSRLQSVATAPSLASSRNSGVDHDLPTAEHMSDDDTGVGSGGGGIGSGTQTPEQEMEAMRQLSRVPSYGTAVKAPTRNIRSASLNMPPEYRALSSARTMPMAGASSAGMETIRERASTGLSRGLVGDSSTSRETMTDNSVSVRSSTETTAENSVAANSTGSSGEQSQPRNEARRKTLSNHMHAGDSDETGRFNLLRMRARGG